MSLRCLLFGHPDEAFVPWYGPANGQLWVEVDCPRCGRTRTLWDTQTDVDAERGGRVE